MSPVKGTPVGRYIATREDNPLDSSSQSYASTGSKYTHTHTHKSWCCCNGGTELEHLVPVQTPFFVPAQDRALERRSAREDKVLLLLLLGGEMWNTGCQHPHHPTSPPALPTMNGQIH